MFKGRGDAGRRLGRALEDYKGEDVLVLAIPRAVAQVYEDWYDVSDEEVLEIMEEWERLR